jgi:hypothetical protein
MYVMYYVSMLRCWQLVRILVRTNHPCLRVGRHTNKHEKIKSMHMITWHGEDFIHTTRSML